jgi:hypothetical protein
MKMSFLLNLKNTGNKRGTEMKKGKKGFPQSKKLHQQ